MKYKIIIHELDKPNKIISNASIEITGNFLTLTNEDILLELMKRMFKIEREDL